MSSENMASREMRGGGFYTEATKGCFDVIANAKDMVMDQMEKAPIPSGNQPFTVIDLGTADGGTVMYLMKDILDKLRSRDANKEALLIYEDQPTNDFKPLFLMTQGMMKGPESFLKHHKGVFVQASGTSFYEQCAPTSTVQFELSFTAMHWLRVTPGKIQNALHSAMATEEERKPFIEQAKKDWEHNLLMRAREMCSGARAVFVNFCTDENGCYLGNTASAGGTKAHMHATFNRIWKQMADEGRITQEEYVNTNFPQHYRKVEEYKAPLEDPSSEVYKAGLRLEQIETKITPCPFAASYKKGNFKSGREFADTYINTLKSWSSGVFLTGLSDNRSPEEKQKLVDEFYGRYADEIAEKPEDHGMDFVHAYIVIRKE